MSPTEPDLFADDSGRFERFKSLFRAQNDLGDLINEVLDDHEHVLQPREGEERDLSLIVLAGFGKGLKTFQAVTRLCALGFGEDAIVLVRANINLLINLAYVLAGAPPVERGDAFIAHGLLKRRRYFEIAHGGRYPAWMAERDWPTIEIAAEGWPNSIETRAKELPDLHYTQGYRLYSSLGHSDVMALNEMIEDASPNVLNVAAGPSDAFLGLALAHSFAVMADVLAATCSYFRINRPDIFNRVGAIWRALSQQEQAESAEGDRRDG